MRAAALFLLGAGAGLAWWFTRAEAPESAATPAPLQLEEVGALETSEPRVIAPPAAAISAPLQLPGCSGDVVPTGPSLQSAINLVQQELWDRCRAILQGEGGSAELRAGLLAYVRRDPDRAWELLQEADDVDQDGFDHALAIAFSGAVMASNARQHDDVARFQGYLSQSLTSPWAPLARAVEARFAGDTYAEMEALREAHRRDPEDAATLLALASVLVRVGPSDEALAALEGYAALVPDDPWALTMKPRVARRAEIESRMREVDRDGVTLLHATRFDASSMQRVHLEVLSALDDAADLLGLPRRPRLRVIVYGSRRDFAAVTCGPGWSGARYDGSLRVPGNVVGSARERITLRHEALHAELGWYAPRAPLWLHEGVAQLFQGRLPSDLERTMTLMARERTYIPFPSMEGSFVVIDDSDSARFAYHQSYAMVAAVLDQDPNGLQNGVRHLREGGSREALLGAMSEPALTGDALLEWVALRR
ncbi:MAG: hypothetical protein AAGE52_27450 [Myxococcota bacterium]